MADWRDSLIDKNVLLAQLREMDMKSICRETQAMPFKEILDRMSETREQERMRKSMSPTREARPQTAFLESLRREKTGSPAGRRIGTASSGSRGSTSKSIYGVPKKEDFTIARFRIPPPVFQCAQTTEPELEKSLYRAPTADTSGRIIRSFSRPTSVPEGAPNWIPPEPDRDLPGPSFAFCTTSYKDSLTKHMDDLISRVDDDYSKLPSNTERERRHKAKVGAELNELVRDQKKLAEDERIAAEFRSRSRAASPKSRAASPGSPKTPGGRTLSPNSRSH